MIWLAWFARNVRHVCNGGRGCRRMYLATVDWLTERPISEAPREYGAHPTADSRWSSRIRARTSADAPGRPLRPRLFHLQNRRNPRRCHVMTVSGLTMIKAERQPSHACESHAHNARTADVRRRCWRLDRWTTASWSEREISRCSKARERTMNWSQWSREKRRDNTAGRYRRTPLTSTNATGTVFSIGTGEFQPESMELTVENHANSSLVPG